MPANNMTTRITNQFFFKNLPIEPPIKNAFLLYDNSFLIAIYLSEVYVNLFVILSRIYAKLTKCQITNRYTTRNKGIMLQLRTE